MNVILREVNTEIHRILGVADARMDAIKAAATKQDARAQLNAYASRNGKLGGLVNP